MAAQHRGTITTWKDQQGFGFITPENGGTAVFLDVSVLIPDQARPAVNMVVRYTLTYDQQQRPRAVRVRLNRKPRMHTTIRLAIVGLFFVILFLATRIISLPLWVLLAYAASSVLTYALYAHDKAMAIKGARRIPEHTLHLLECLCGWPGALLAQAVYRHKTVKAAYQARFWMMIAVNLVFLIGYSWLRLSNSA